MDGFILQIIYNTGYKTKIALTAKITYFGANIDTVCYEEVSHGVTVHVAEGAVPQAVRDFLGETLNWNVRTVGELKSE